MTIDVDAYYRRYGPMVLRRCRKLLGQEQDALDAMQETFMLATRYQEKLDERGASSLLYRMATNVCLNVIRAQGRRPELDDTGVIYQIACLDDVQESVQARDLLRRMFKGQQPSTRQMAIMFWLEGMTYDEIAAELEMSSSGVRRRLRTFRESLERQGLLAQESA